MVGLDSVTELSREIVKEVSSFLGSTIGELIKDEIHFLRWKHALRIVDRARKVLRKRSVTGRTQIPVGLAIRFLDSAALEDDPDLQELWAQLLANAVDPNSGYDLSKTHISILSELNALDALVLAYFKTQGWLQFKQVAELTGRDALDSQKIASDLGVDEKAVSLSVGNLWRLGCLIQEPTYESGIGPSTAKNSSFRPSPLAKSLLEAVKQDD